MPLGILVPLGTRENEVICSPHNMAVHKKHYTAVSGPSDAATALQYMEDLRLTKKLPPNPLTSDLDIIFNKRWTAAENNKVKEIFTTKS